MLPIKQSNDAIRDHAGKGTCRAALQVGSMQSCAERSQHNQRYVCIRMQAYACKMANNHEDIASQLSPT